MHGCFGEYLSELDLREGPGFRPERAGGVHILVAAILADQETYEAVVQWPSVNWWSCKRRSLKGIGREHISLGRGVPSRLRGLQSPLTVAATRRSTGRPLHRGPGRGRALHLVVLGGSGAQCRSPFLPIGHPSRPPRGCNRLESVIISLSLPAAIKV